MAMRRPTVIMHPASFAAMFILLHLASRLLHCRREKVFLRKVALNISFMKNYETKHGTDRSVHEKWGFLVTMRVCVCVCVGEM